MDTLLLAVMMGSMAWAGVLADRVGIRAVLYGAGILCLAGGAAGWALLTRVRVSGRSAAEGEPTIESG